MWYCFFFFFSFPSVGAVKINEGKMKVFGLLVLSSFALGWGGLKGGGTGACYIYKIFKTLSISPTLRVLSSQSALSVTHLYMASSQYNPFFHIILKITNDIKIIWRKNNQYVQTRQIISMHQIPGIL